MRRVARRDLVTWDSDARATAWTRPMRQSSFSAGRYPRRWLLPFGQTKSRDGDWLRSMFFMLQSWSTAGAIARHGSR